MPRMRLILAALCALFLSVSGSLAFDAALLGQNDRALQEVQGQLDQIVGVLRRPNLSDKDLADARTSLDAIRATSAERSLKLAAALADVDQQVHSFGPPPGEGSTEGADVSKARGDLIAVRDRLQALKSQFDVVGVQAEQNSATAAALQRDQFFQRIFDRNRSILAPSLWSDTLSGFGLLVSGIGLLLRQWSTQVEPSGNPLRLLLVPFFALLLAGAYGFIIRRARGWVAHYLIRNRPVDDMRRLWRIVRGVITVAVVIVILFLPIRLSLDAGGYLTPRLLLLWTALVAVVGTTAFFYVLARRMAAPGEPDWRIIDLDETAARRFPVIVAIMAFVSTLHTQLGKIAQGLFLSFSYTIGQSALAALVLLCLMSILLLVLKNQDGLQDPKGRRLYFSWAASFTPFVWLMILLGFGALLGGFISLADYIVHQTVRTAMVLTLLFILYHLFDSAVAASFDPRSSFGLFLRRMTGLGERGISRLGLVFRTAVDVVLLVAGIPLLVLLWTLTWVDFNGFYNTLSLGITVGKITISPGILLVMLFILVAGVVATKLINTWLERRILRETHISRGVQDSILKGSSYVGYIVAGLLALMATGVDFSNLALIAGALGLGIGLGLQSIVNNFVSGLIILAERPIQVGDWVSLPTGEGVVRRINVRSTEIETFDSCTIILPNSMLVSEPVRNWTHTDNTGRFLVAVTVDYGSDAELVRNLLLDTAIGHDQVLRSPKPSVALARFGQTGLEFELRAYVADIFDASTVASDIRFQLLALFREKGINIPQPVGVMGAPKA